MSKIVSITKEQLNNLIKTAMEKAIALVYQDFGKRPLTLGVHRENAAAGRFYEQHGFRKTGVFEGEDEYYLRMI